MKNWNNRMPLQMIRQKGDGKMYCGETKGENEGFV
jgi:hypothetical protein